MVTFNTIKRCFYRFLGLNIYPSVDEYRSKGIKIGHNSDVLNSSIDTLIPELLTIGDNTTVTNATILTHDASTKKFLGYTKYGRVSIGNNVFIGAGAIILPNTSIGNNVIVGGGAVVASDIPENCVCVGNPAKPICSFEEYNRKMAHRKDNNLVVNEFPWNLTKQKRLEIVRKCSEQGIVFVR